MKNIPNLILIITFLLSISCQKDFDKSYLNKTKDIEQVIKDWQFQYKLNSNYSLTINSVVNTLDIDNNFVIENDKKLYFIKIDDKINLNDNYLLLRENNNKINTVGIISIKKIENYPSKDLIKSFFKDKSLKRSTSLELKTLNGQLLKKIEVDKNGKEVYKNLIDIKTISRNINNNISVNSIEQDPIGLPPLICTDWWLVTYIDGLEVERVYINSTCTGGDTGGGGDPNEYITNGSNDDGLLSCQSFQFKSMTSNMYEAGISGLMFTMDVAGTGQPIVYPFRNIYIGFPKSSIANNKTYTPADAAAITAKAMNAAGAAMQIKYWGSSTSAVHTPNGIEKEFIELVQSYINSEINAGSTIGIYRHGNNTVTSQPVWNDNLTRLWNGLTGKGCN